MPPPAPRTEETYEPKECRYEDDEAEDDSDEKNMLMRTLLLERCMRFFVSLLACAPSVCYHRTKQATWSSMLKKLHYVYICHCCQDVNYFAEILKDKGKPR